MVHLLWQTNNKIWSASVFKGYLFKESTCSLKPAISKSRQSFASQFRFVDVVRAVESAVVKAESDSVLSPKSLNGVLCPHMPPFALLHIVVKANHLFHFFSERFNQIFSFGFSCSSACSASFFSDFNPCEAKKVLEFCGQRRLTFSISATRIALFP